MSLIMDVLSKTKQESETAKETSATYSPISPESSQFKPQDYFNPDRIRRTRAMLIGTKSRWLLALILVSVVFAGLFLYRMLQSHDSAKAKLSVAASQPKTTAVITPWNVAMNALTEKTKRKSSDLEGIVLDGKEPYCLIAGKILKTGDYWEEKKIAEITREGVLLKSLEGKATFMKLQR